MTSTLSQRRKQLKKTSNDPAHLVVIARAGTGKTTTLVEGLKIVQGLEPAIVPSVQQEAIWSELAKSKGVGSVCFAAFNKSIQLELQNRVPKGVRAVTMHGLGFGAVGQSFKLNRKDAVNGYKSHIIVEEITGKDIRSLDILMVNAVTKLVGLCKANLTTPDYDTLMELAGQYDIELNGSSSEIFELVEKVLDISKNQVNRHGFIDFNDMIWLPVIHGLPVFRYDLLLIDEAQDLNRCQQALALKAGKRIVLCGDPCQAIYGFAGADSKSLDRMQEVLGATDEGCQTLPLTVTRRCGKKIVAEAQKLVPDFEAHESTGEGKVLTVTKEGKGQVVPAYRDTVNDKDMILCRTNAPLVSECFKLIRAGRKANIQGRDVGKGLINMVERFKARNITQLSEKLEAWYNTEFEKENKKKFPCEARLIAVSDKRDCLDCFIKEAKNLPDVTKRIQEIFSDESKGGILLSSIHQAKGLEAERVFFLMLKEAPIPHPMAKTSMAKEQEYNLLYVGITRASKELVYVTN